MMQIKKKEVTKLQLRVIEALEEVTRLPPYESAPDAYTDWGLTGPFKVKTSRGECAA
ncbi:MAG: hypothetical protein M1503_04435 [Thaumarchaeota archaeon]|nr:hypothetical protein [Nitrososphaerota archaeon]MCL5317497.1 hypothetical protein [Nitrososphaerota archaeon]